MLSEEKAVGVIKYNFNWDISLTYQLEKMYVPFVLRIRRKKTSKTIAGQADTILFLHTHSSNKQLIN